MNLNADDEYVTLLTDAYRGELLGAALFDAFAELELAGHPGRSRAVLDWYLESAPA